MLMRKITVPEVDMATQSSMLHVRVDDDTKARATATLDALGLSVSDAVRILMHRIIADQAFPLELKVPNRVTLNAMAEAEDLINSRRARFDSAEALIADLEQNADR
jgi:DNA-damage-inducible protein J